MIWQHFLCSLHLLQICLNVIIFIQTPIVSTLILFLLLLLFQNCCIVKFILLKPLKSNFPETASTGQCVGAIPQGPHTLHRDRMTPPPPLLLHCTILYYNLLYIGVSHVTINISIRYGSEWAKFCCSYVFCYKMVTNGSILVFEVSIEPYCGLILDASM